MLNKQQLKAVEHISGPLLIIAGAGSGKTTVLIERIKNMIETHNIKPKNILAVTFTNKAANEMVERLSDKLGEELIYGLEMSTFHSFCNNVLKTNLNFIDSNFTSAFEIADENLVRAYIKQITKGRTKIHPRTYADYISSLKNELVTAQMFVTEDYSSEFIDKNKVEKMVSKWHKDNPDHMSLLGYVYMEYETIMKKTNTMDFDDLIMQTVHLFQENPSILNKYQEKYKYLLIDEYQDTNRVQYVLAKMLANKYKNIAVVGDDAQSIYAFRGSDIRNILNFDFDYSDAKVIKLEQNYRSTKTILQAANELITKNKNQKKKKLFTDNPVGKPITLMDSSLAEEEASMVASKILDLVKEDNRKYSDFTILYRANRQSARIEQALKFESIPYFIYSGRSFFDIPEVRIIIKYMQFIHNPNNIEAFNEIIQYPKRRIGDKTIEKISAEFLNRSIVDILEDPSGIVRMQAIGKKEAKEFVDVIRELQSLAPATPVNELIEKLIVLLKFKDSVLPSLNRPDANEAMKNIETLLEILVSKQLKNNKKIYIKEFVEEIALGSPKDEPSTEHVKLMTIHSSKGLEFPIVFVINMQEDSFPNIMFKDEYSQEELEEERRLAYVAFTRAKEELYLSKHNYMITKKGESYPLTPSPFLNEFSRKILVTEYL